jgi:hypothetical protein
MRKITATSLVLAVVWIGYTAWPLYDLLVLVRAIEVRDVETVKRHVYFDAVGRSLSSQLIAANEHDRDRLADFRKFGIWLWQI